MVEEPTKGDLARDFAWLVLLAKLRDEKELIAFAKKEWKRAKAWVASDNEGEGSFCWACDSFDLEPDAVRRAIKERRK